MYLGKEKVISRTLNITKFESAQFSQVQKNVSLVVSLRLTTLKERLRSNTGPIRN